MNGWVLNVVELSERAVCKSLKEPGEYGLVLFLAVFEKNLTTSKALLKKYKHC